MNASATSIRVLVCSLGAFLSFAGVARCDTKLNCHVRNTSTRDIVVVDEDGKEYTVKGGDDKSLEITVETKKEPHPSGVGHLVKFKNPVKGTNNWIQFHDKKGKVQALWLRVILLGKYPGHFWYYPAKKIKGEQNVADEIEPIDPNPTTCWCTDDDGYQVAGTEDAPPCCMKNGKLECKCDRGVAPFGACCPCDPCEPYRSRCW